jgi:replicative DNA helicase
MTQTTNGRRNGFHIVQHGQQRRNGTHPAPSGPSIPADIQAEEATLGAILTNPQGFVQVAGWLQAEHFYMERHAIIYRAIQACYSRNTPPDAITVSSELHAEINLAGDRTEGTGIPSDYPDLDTLLGGFQRSDLIILAARPSTGKTALSLNFAYNIARIGKRVGFFSLEMSRGQLLHRLAAMESGIDSQKLRQVNLLTDDEAGRLMETMGDLTELPLYIQDTSNLSVSDRSYAVARKSGGHALSGSGRRSPC